MVKNINIDWKSVIGDWYNRKEVQEFLHTPYVNKLLRYILKEYYTKTIYPERQFIFKSFLTCSPEKLRVVILGSSPYNNGLATGLAFANNEENLRLSSPLLTIQECVERTVYDGFKLDFDTTLESWSKQGVMLLNTSLTVEQGKINNHKKPWVKFIQFFIKYISQNFPGTIFLLWGEEPQKYKIIDGIDLSKTCNVFEAECPSFSAYNNTRWDCNHFNMVNDLIEIQNGKDYKIKW